MAPDEHPAPFVGIGGTCAACGTVVDGDDNWCRECAPEVSA